MLVYTLVVGTYTSVQTRHRRDGAGGSDTREARSLGRSSSAIRNRFVTKIKSIQNEIMDTINSLIPEDAQKFLVFFVNGKKVSYFRFFGVGT